MTALIRDVSGQASQTKRQAGTEEKQGSCAGRHNADDEKKLSEFAHRVHAIECPASFYLKYAANIAEVAAAQPVRSCQLITIDIYIKTYIVRGMSLEHILLGLLREPASGYDLKAVFDERIHYFWAAELSQIYPALQGLERKGLLRSREAPAKRGPRRRVYQTTPAGHRVLREWLDKAPELKDERILFQAKVYFMDELGDLGKTLQYMKRLREDLASRLETVQKTQRRWAENDPTYPDDLSPKMFHVFLTLRKGLCSLVAHIQWCDESIRRIESRMEKEKSNGRTVSKSSLDSHHGGHHRADRVLGPRGRKQGRPAAR